MLIFNCYLFVLLIIRYFFYKNTLPPLWLLQGSPMLMDPHPSQQHAGLQHAVWWPYQEVTRPKVHHSVLAWDYYFHLTRMVVGAISSFLQRQNYEPTLAIFSRYWVNFNCWKWPNIERQNLVIWSHCRFSRFKGLLPESSVPILGNFFKIFGKFSRVYLALGQSSNLLWEFWFLWAYFHFIINGQILDT